MIAIVTLLAMVLVTIIAAFFISFYKKEIQIKIIAVKKSKEDRTVALTPPTLSPGQVPLVKLTESKVIIKAGKKSATTVVKIFPKQMPMKQHNATLTCIPQWKEGLVSKLTIQMNKN